MPDYAMLRYTRRPLDDTPLSVADDAATCRQLARHLGRDHELALALWATGWYEARLLSAFVDEPERVTPAQMDRWARDFDNWGVCDTVCFCLFDRTPHAWRKIERWSRDRDDLMKLVCTGETACATMMGGVPSLVGQAVSPAGS